MTLSKNVLIVRAVALGLALSAPLTAAIAEPVRSASAMPSFGGSHLHNGDLVRIRTGGPLMMVTGTDGDQVMCSWSEWDGQVRSGRFPVAMLTAPL
jgi:uncharacterized protein YodC (DUF2158 family)